MLSIRTLLAVISLFANAMLVAPPATAADWYKHSALDGALTVEFPSEPSIVPGKVKLTDKPDDPGVDQWSAQLQTAQNGMWAVTYFRVPKSDIADMFGANFLQVMPNNLIEAHGIKIESKAPLSHNGYTGVDIVGRDAKGVGRHMRYCYNHGIFVIIEYVWLPGASPDPGANRFIESLALN